VRRPGRARPFWFRDERAKTLIFIEITLRRRSFFWLGRLLFKSHIMKDSGHKALLAIATDWPQKGLLRLAGAGYP
jgi:hypothetical protein